MEHRWGARVAVDFPVRVKALRFSVNDARLADLSVSGARIEAKIEARLLSCVQIAIVLPRWPGRASPLIEAYVARNYEDGFGIEWCEFAPRIVSELLRGEAIARSSALRHRSLAHRPAPPASASHFNRLASGNEVIARAPELLIANGI
jgi:hypothetical protein